MGSSTIAIIITIITFALLISNKLPFVVVSCIAALSMGMLIPEMKLSQIYSSLGSNAVVMVAGMCIVGDAIFQTGVAQKIGAYICRSSFVKTEKRFIVLTVVICTIMSAFMSNSGCIAVWMPLIATIAAGSNGKIRSKMVIFPAATACVIGGGATLVGSTPQAIANSLLIATPGFEQGMGVFDMTLVVLPICVLQILFWSTIGYSILKWALKPEEPGFDEGNYYVQAPAAAHETDMVPQWKRTMSVAVLVGCILGFCLSGFAPFNKYLDVAVVPMLGATILLGSGCIPVSSLKALPWDILISIGTITALGTGLSVSGGGALIADTILNAVGVETLSPKMLMVVLVIMSVVLTQFLSCGGVASMLVPIVIPLAQSMGVSPMPYVVVIAAAVNMAFMTPVGTGVNAQILAAGYKFTDYVKIGLPLTVLCMIVLCIMGPVVYF